MNPVDKNVRKISTELQKQKLQSRPTLGGFNHPEDHFIVDTALIYDAIRLFAEALQQLSISKRLEAKNLFCNESHSWEHGYSIINYMKTVSKYLFRKID